MEFDFSLIIHSIPLLLRGAGLTLEITALAVGLGLAEQWREWLRLGRMAREVKERAYD